MPEAHPPLIWLELGISETEAETPRIRRIATLVTDGALEVVAEGPVLLVSPSTTVEAAQSETLGFLHRHCTAGQSPLCGDSIGDTRRGLIREMPALQSFLHYRSIDVGTLRAVVHRWYPDLASFPTPATEGLGLQASLAELRYYRQHVFR